MEPWVKNRDTNWIVINVYRYSPIQLMQQTKQDWVILIPLYDQVSRCWILHANRVGTVFH